MSSQRSLLTAGSLSRSFLLDAVRVLKEQGAAWVYLLLGAREQRVEHELYNINNYDNGDRVSASSGIASASSMPWPDDQVTLDDLQNSLEANLLNFSPKSNNDVNNCTHPGVVRIVLRV